MIKLLLILSIGLTGKAFAQTEKTDVPTGGPVKPALLVIDIQNAYLPHMSSDEKPAAMNVINGAIWFFRQRDLPVIRVYNSDPRWGPEEGTEDFDFPRSVIVTDRDPMVHKHVPNAFSGTNLDSLLRARGCNALFLCGLSATGCVLATYFGGIDHGYKTFLIKEAVMSNNANYTAMIRDICESISFESMMFFLLGR